LRMPGPSINWPAIPDAEARNLLNPTVSPFLGHFQLQLRRLFSRRLRPKVTGVPRLRPLARPFECRHRATKPGRATGLDAPAHAVSSRGVDFNIDAQRNVRTDPLVASATSVVDPTAQSLLHEPATDPRMTRLLSASLGPSPSSFRRRDHATWISTPSAVGHNPSCHPLSDSAACD
jgi:hypothetical protein